MKAGEIDPSNPVRVPPISGNVEQETCPILSPETDKHSKILSQYCSVLVTFIRNTTSIGFPIQRIVILFLIPSTGVDRDIGGESGRRA